MVNNKIQAAEENLIHVYNRFPIALDHGLCLRPVGAAGRDLWPVSGGEGRQSPACGSPAGRMRGRD